jgi:2-dehydro-3-deoxygalactonokinase
VEKGDADVNEGGAALIGLDWGTTSLRAYRVGRDGAVLDRRSREAGILKVERGDFAGALAAAAGDWLRAEPGLPVVAAGMVGSRQGWREVPYVPCPAGLAELAGALATVAGPDGRTVWLVPGLAHAAAGFPDVMRGEETQILGALATAPGDAPRCFVLPGTHSKWAWCARGRVERFATYMTGEVYDVLTRHSILGRLMAGDRGHDAQAYARGLARARASAGAPPGRLLHDLFSARTLGLTAEVPAEGLRSYLSGLLIGAEAAAALTDAPPDGVTILGADALSARYAEAIAAAGARAVVGDADAAARGLHAIARAAGLIEKEHGHG